MRSPSARSCPARATPLVAVVALFSLPTLACAPGAGDSLPPDDERAAAIAALEAETGTSWTVRWHADVGTPALMEGRTARLLAGAGAGALATARQFLADHPVLFRVDPHDELAEEETSTRDEVGMVHVRVAQRHAGLPVLGHQLRLHFDGDGSLVRLDGKVAPLRTPERLSPAISTDDATAAARAALPAGSELDPPELSLDAAAEASPGASVDGPSARLAFRIEARHDDETSPERTAFFVDANTGEVYRRQQLLDVLRGHGTGVYGEAHDFEVASRGSRYYLEDATAGSPAQRIYSAGGAARLPGTEVSSDRIDRWDQAATGRGAAVDLAAWLEAIRGYYQRAHGRRGPNDKGDGVRATVHYGRRFANAFWNGRQLAFGDGDGVHLAPPAAALDVVAHEFTHAVSESAAHLGRDGEAGALNEGISDVFACFIERAVLGKAANWAVGERVALDPGGAENGLRNLADPHRGNAPAHASEAAVVGVDGGGVHWNATIIGHAAFLMSEGGVNRVSGLHVDGIGADLAERIWYRALTRYLGPDSGFRDCADATVAAARDLAGRSSPVVTRVKRAWQAVGVL